MSTYDKERYLRNKASVLKANNTWRRKQDDEYKQTVKEYCKENWQKYYSVNKERISLAKKVAYQAKKLAKLEEANRYACEMRYAEDDINQAGF